MKKLIYVTGAAVLVAILAVAVSSLPEEVFAASLGPNAPTAAADQLNGDGWLNPSNIEANDGKPAIGQMFPSGVSFTGDLYGTGYGFSVPAGSTINGIQASVVLRQSSTICPTAYWTTQLLKAGTPVGTNKASQGTQLPTATTTVSYGTTSDLWGTTWSSSDINNANFGLDLNYEELSGCGGLAYVDYETITVTYTPSSGGSPSVVSNTTYFGW